MRRRLSQRLAAWICLLALGLDMAAHALVPVVCSSAGGSRIEWVCLRADAGADHPGHHHHDGLPPCEDRPFGDDHDQAHHLLVRPDRSGHAALTLAPVMVAWLPPPVFDPPVRGVRPRSDARVRPPDAVGRLRTIVMIV